MQKQKIYINKKFRFFEIYLLRINDFNEDEMREIKKKVQGNSRNMQRKHQSSMVSYIPGILHHQQCTRY